MGSLLTIAIISLKFFQSPSPKTDHVHFSPKDLQPLIAAANVCINSASSAGKLNGLLALKVLAEDCNAQLFIQVLTFSLVLVWAEGFVPSEKSSYQSAFPVLSALTQ